MIGSKKLSGLSSSDKKLVLDHFLSLVPAKPKYRILVQKNGSGVFYNTKLLKTVFINRSCCVLLSLCDGKKTIQDIIESLTYEFSAKEGLIDNASVILRRLENDEVIKLQRRI